MISKCDNFIPNYHDYKRGDVIYINEFQNNEHKIRPAIILNSYPDHIDAIKLSSQENKHDICKFRFNNRNAYIRPIYFCKLKKKELDMVLKPQRGVKTISRKNKIFSYIGLYEFCNFLELDYFKTLRKIKKGDRVRLDEFVKKRLYILKDKIKEF